MPVRVGEASLPAFQETLSSPLGHHVAFTSNEQGSSHGSAKTTTLIYEPAPVLHVVILNLMPNKPETEAQLLRLLKNTILTVNATFLRVSSHQSKHTDSEHLRKYYVTFDQIRTQKFDGLIITGAPVENLAFEEVNYWPELTEIFRWAEQAVAHSYYICWASQAHLYYRYHIPKQRLPFKLSGVFLHTLLRPTEPAAPPAPAFALLNGFDDEVYVPHSRHTTVSLSDLTQQTKGEVIPLVVSEQAGWYLAASQDARHVYVTGHSEYDPLTLKKEYVRDTTSGNAELQASVRLPCNYFPGDDPAQPPVVRWRSHGALLFLNWLHLFVYSAAVKRMLLEVSTSEEKGFRIENSNFPQEKASSSTSISTRGPRFHPYGSTTTVALQAHL